MCIRDSPGTPEPVWGCFMSFHPKMDYGRGHHQSARALPEEGAPFTYTPERRAELEKICARYPADQRKSAILAALYLAQHQQGYLTRNAMRHVAEAIGCTAVSYTH